jgi:hypothetical protein
MKHTKRIFGQVERLSSKQLFWCIEHIPGFREAVNDVARVRADERQAAERVKKEMEAA